MNQEVLYIKELIEKHSIQFAFGYITAITEIDNPPNNGIDYQWALSCLNCIAQKKE